MKKLLSKKQTELEIRNAAIIKAAKPMRGGKMLIYGHLAKEFNVSVGTIRGALKGKI